MNLVGKSIKSNARDGLLIAIDIRISNSYLVFPIRHISCTITKRTHSKDEEECVETARGERKNALPGQSNMEGAGRETRRRNNYVDAYHGSFLPLRRHFVTFIITIITRSQRAPYRSDC